MTSPLNGAARSNLAMVGVSNRMSSPCSNSNKVPFRSQVPTRFRNNVSHPL